jgi:hypothetical protein
MGRRGLDCYGSKLGQVTISCEWVINLRFHTMRGISGLAVDLLASQGGLCCMVVTAHISKLLNYLVMFCEKALRDWLFAWTFLPVH